MDTAQDSQLASHEAVIKATSNSLQLTNNLVKELDRMVTALNTQVKLQ